MAETILSQIKAPNSYVFRRVLLKRKSAMTGLHESVWQDISSDVKTWGSIRREIDNVRYSKIKFGDVLMKFENSSGRYNPHEDDASFWFGYASQQRSLIKIEAGFTHSTLSSDNIWTNTEYPSTPSVFYGIISGDLYNSDDNHVQFSIRPLLQVFRDYPAKNLTGFTSTGLTATQFFQMIRDQTDGSSNFIFRPFFGDTTTNWNIGSTSNIYANLNTNNSVDVFDKTVWDIMEKLAESEDKIIYVDNLGTFNFTTRDVTSTVAFHFLGNGFVDTEYGHTIKKVSKFGKRQTDFYSRVEVKWIDSNTFTAVRVKETAFAVTGSNDAWNLGHRTFKFENFWIPTITVADTILDNIYNNVTVLKNNIEFTSSFVPHIDILDRVRMSYDSSALNPTSRWDLFDWSADDTSTAQDLYWDRFRGDAIRLIGADFKILSIDLSLDKFETKIVAIEI